MKVTRPLARDTSLRFSQCIQPKHPEHLLIQHQPVYRSIHQCVLRNTFRKPRVNKELNHSAVSIQG